MFAGRVFETTGLHQYVACDIFSYHLYSVSIYLIITINLTFRSNTANPHRTLRLTPRTAKSGWQQTVEAIAVRQCLLHWGYLQMTSHISWSLICYSMWLHLWTPHLYWIIFFVNCDCTGWSNVRLEYLNWILGAIQLIRDTQGGGGVRQVPKKCHLIFEWPLTR